MFIYIHENGDLFDLDHTDGIINAISGSDGLLIATLDLSEGSPELSDDWDITIPVDEIDETCLKSMIASHWCQTQALAKYIGYSLFRSSKDESSADSESFIVDDLEPSKQLEIDSRNDDEHDNLIIFPTR